MGKSMLTPAERKALYGVFADYRACKQAIATRSIPVTRGFASAMHPDQIHGSRVHPPLPKSVSAYCAVSGFSDAAYRRFVWRVDWHIKRLAPYRKSIIRKRFLSSGSLPTDAEVHADLRKEGWYVSKSFYMRQKEEGLEELFKSFKPSNSAENA